MAITNPTISTTSGAGKAAGKNAGYKQYRYPHDLDTSTMPYMVIRINELVNSHFKQSNGGTVAANNTRGNSTSGQLAQSQLSNKQSAGIMVVAGAAAGAGAGAIAGGMGDLFAKAGILTNGISSVAGGAVVGAGLGGVTTKAYSSVAPTALKQMQRLSTEIVLYMPTGLPVSYNLTYNETETKFLSNAATALNKSAEQKTALAQSAAKSSGVVDSIMSKIKNVDYGQLAIATTGGINEFNIAAGIAINPRMEQMFSGVSYRTFSFSFDLAARNKSEFDDIIHIIYLLKFHAHPEFVSPEEFLYLYPSNFDIRFFLGGEENTYIPRIGTSVLTSIKTDYAPDMVWAQLKDGAVPHIKLELNFTEVGLLSKETIAAGY
jgi:hypothetical protein